MYTKKITELLEEYNTYRTQKLDPDQFEALLYTFPSVLVAHADGRIDDHEKDYLRHIPDDLATGFALNGIDDAPLLNENYFEEIEYLVQDINKWHDKFLAALKDQLQGSQNEKNAIFQLMWRTADSSEDISENERKRIAAISVKLGL